MSARTLDFTRSDYLATRVLVVVGMLSVPVTWAASAAPWVMGDALRENVRLDGSAPVTEPAPVPGVDARWEGTAQLTLPDASTTQWLAHLAPDLLLGLAVLLVLVPVLRLVGAVQRGDAFSSATVGWLRTVALTVLLAPWILLLTRAAVDAHLLAHAFDGAFQVWIPVTGATLAVSVVGLVIAVVAEAFRRGLRLERDVEGLV